MPTLDIETVWRAQSRRVLATLIRLLGDFDLAEEALHDAFAAAAARWPVDGTPDNPVAWLVSAGRFRAIDTLRRRMRFDRAAAELAHDLETAEDGVVDPETVADDQLRLIFVCCHPVLPREQQVALTLREVCGLTTEEIARAFLVSPPTLAQRVVRAKARIRDARLPYVVPEWAELASRLEPVLAVIYLVFNEGYAAHSGDSLIRSDLSSEAVRLCRLLCSLLPDGEALGLLALMLLHDSRRPARLDAEGEIVLLADQDRRLWDRAMVTEAETLIAQAFATRQIGPYTLQAAIAAEHARAATAEATDWPAIVGLYDVLLRAAPSPVVALNRAVAVGMARGAEAGLGLIEDLLAGGTLAGYHLAHAAQGDMLMRLGRREEARDAFASALELCRVAPEQRFLVRRIAGLS